MGIAFRLRTFTEVLSAMFSTARSLLGKGVDLNRGSVIRTILEAAALQDAEQYVQIGKLLDLFSIDTATNEDLDRRFLDFGLIFDADFSRFGALTSIGNVVIGDQNLQVGIGSLAGDVDAGAVNFSVTQDAAPNDFATVAGGDTFVVTVGLAGIDQQETVLVSITGSSMAILAPTTGFNFIHKLGEPVRLAATASKLAVGAPLGSVAFTMLPGTGDIFEPGKTIIFDRDIPASRETLTVDSVLFDVVTTTAPSTKAHTADAIVYKSTVGVDRPISAGLELFVPAEFGTNQTDFVTTAGATLLDGDYETPPLPVESVLPGKDTRATSNSIIGFKAKPFPGATVTNPEGCVRGRDRENDKNYRARGKQLLQSLSRGTKTAIEARVLGLEDPDTRRVVEYAEIIEPVGFGISILYISDGSATFGVLFTEVPGREVLISDGEMGDRRGRLDGTAPFESLVDTGDPFNSTPRLFKSFDRGGGTTAALTVGPSFITDTAHVAFPLSRIGKTLKTDDDQFFLITGVGGVTLSFAPDPRTPSKGVYSIYDFGVAPLQQGADFVFDPTTGDLELSVANQLIENDGLIVADDGAPIGRGMYAQASGLGAFVQKVVNGDPNDFQNFPGIKAAGTQVFVQAPTIIVPAFEVQILPEEGFNDVTLAPFVKAAVERIVNGLGIGDTIILSDIIVEVKAIVGVKDVHVLTPTENVSIGSDQLPRITSDDVEVV